MIAIGTRTSRLARAQAEQVQRALADAGHATELVPTDTFGDRDAHAPVHELGVAGAFTTRLEAGLQAEEIDLAVHSLKDLPTEPSPGLEIAAVLDRGRPGDVLIVRPHAWAPGASPPIEEGARVATSGPRRRSQLLAERDVTVATLRGNIDTRIAKLRAGRFDALVTASVVLDRMELALDDLHVHHLDPQAFPPAPGQAAITVQAREDSPAAHHARALDHEPTRRAVDAERRLLAELGGGCGLPLGAWVRPAADGWRLSATFAGHGWDPTHEARLVRREAVEPTPQACLDTVEGNLSPELTPRRPALATTPVPEGEPVLVVASQRTAREWSARLREAGRAAYPVPTRAVEPTPTPAPATAGIDWIAVTSPDAAAPLAEALDDVDAEIAAVGPTTGRRLQAEGLPCHLVAPDHDGASLARALAEIAPQARVLLAQADTTHGDLAQGLREGGLAVEAWTAYEVREHPPRFPEAVDLPARAAVVTSPRNAAALADAEPDPVAETRIAIGPSTADRLRELGLEPVTADRPTPDSVEAHLP